MMNLNELARQLTRNETVAIHAVAKTKYAVNYPGLESTRYFHTLNNIIRNDGRTKAILSSAFWQGIILSPIFRNFLKRFGGAIRVASRGRFILVMHSNDNNRERYDLMVLSPDVRSDQRASIPIGELFDFSSGSRELRRIFNFWIGKRRSELEILKKDNLVTDITFERQTSLLDAITRDDNFLQELGSKQPYSIIMAEMPETIFTSSITSNACGVALGQNEKPISTAGVATSNRAGIQGVTAALHGVVPDPKALYDMFNKQGAACVVGKEVYINGKPGVIREADLITDSCFIEINHGLLPEAYKIDGPLKYQAPYRRESVKFDGSWSQKIATVVTEVDISIPFVIRGQQARVYTHAVTNPGDSGTALVNERQQVLGFGYRRTGLGESLEFSEWIWAQSVYDALQLED